MSGSSDTAIDRIGERGRQLLARHGCRSASRRCRVSCAGSVAKFTREGKHVVFVLYIG